MTKCKNIYKNTLLIFIIQIFCMVKIFSQSVPSYKDCETPFYICNLGTYYFDNVAGIGTHQDVQKPLVCADETFKETNSFWIAFTSETDGIVTFTIQPKVISDDYDFIVFQSVGQKCTSLEPIRCMTSGKSIGDNLNNDSSCLGSTGLSFRSVDEFEQSGCRSSSDNFLKMLRVEKGEDYFIFINNFESEEGFSITFEGDVSLRSTESCGDTMIPIEMLQVYPNPTIDVLNVSYLSKDKSLIQMEIVDISGKSIRKWNESPQKGQNISSFSTLELPSATYLLIMSQGDFKTTRQFIKQ